MARLENFTLDNLEVILFNAIQVVRISPHGKLVATGGDDGHLRVWSFPDLAKVLKADI